MSRRPNLLVALAGVAVLLGACSGSDLPAGDGPRDGGTSAPGAPADGAGAGPANPGPARPDPNQPRWGWDGTAWVNHGGPAPACEDVLPSPVDLSLVTSVLYPGQVRGDYKAHGGFRFDGQPAGAITVVSPIDGVALRGSRYLAGGEIQYTLDLVDPCGRMVRLGHLRTLAPKWDALFEALPAPVEMDSRSTAFPEGITVTQGEVVATAVGLIGTGNTFVDIGMYDLRQRNAASADPAWLAQHNNDTHAYALCWFQLLSPEAQALIDALPAADGKMGRTSDYCR